MREFIETYKALSDETRLRILSLLLHSRSELCVCEFTDTLEVPQYNVSRHLKILKHSGLVEERKEGRWVYFRLAKDCSAFAETIFKSIRQIPELLLSKDLGELEKRLAIRTNGKCLLGIQKGYLTGSQPKKEQMEKIQR